MALAWGCSGGTLHQSLELSPDPGIVMSPLMDFTLPCNAPNNVIMILGPPGFDLVSDCPGMGGYRTINKHKLCATEDKTSFCEQNYFLDVLNTSHNLLSDM